MQNDGDIQQAELVSIIPLTLRNKFLQHALSGESGSTKNDDIKLAMCIHWNVMLSHEHSVQLQTAASQMVTLEMQSKRYLQSSQVRNDALHVRHQQMRCWSLADLGVAAMAFMLTLDEGLHLERGDRLCLVCKSSPGVEISTPLHF